MIKWILIFVLLFGAHSVFSQSVIQRSTGTNTINDPRLMASKNLFVPRYIDTMAANVDIGIDTCGALIFTHIGNTYWFRACSPKRWVKILNTINGGLQEVTDINPKTTDTIIAGGLRTGYIFGDTADLEDYEIDVFPDLQVESSENADTAVMGSMFNWVVANRTTENIKAVLQVGDLTQDANTAQFTKIDSNYDKFDAMPLPQLNYLAVPGNHDFNGGGVGGGRFFTMYNSWMGPSRFAGKTFYGGNLNNSNENYYIKFKAGPDSVLVLGLEFLPRNATLTWAQSVLDSFPNHKTLVVTHAHITAYGEKAMDTSRFSTDWYGLVTDNDGQDVWNKFIRKNKQIAFVFAGHYIYVTTTVAQALANTNLGLPVVHRITQTGEYGNVIHQLVVNYQTDSIGGNGYFMRMKFKPRTGKVDVSFYSAYLNRYDARFPSYTLDYPSIKVDASVGISGVNGSLKVAGETTFDSTAFFSKFPKNRIPIFNINGRLDTVSNSFSRKYFISNGVDQAPTFQTPLVSDFPTDSGKYVLNQLAYPQLGNWWIKGKAVVGTHNTYPTTLASGLPAQFYVTQGAANWGSVVVRAAGASASGAGFGLATTRGNDPNTLVASNVADALGNYSWFGVSSTPSWVRAMYIRGYVYAVGAGYVSCGYDFRAINTSGTDIQVFNITADGNAIIGTGNAQSNADKLRLEGTLLVTDTVKTPNIASKVDTTNFKPVVVDANGNHFKMTGWPSTDVAFSGTNNTVVKFTSSSTIGNSQITDNGTNVGINVSPSYRLHVGGSVGVNGALVFNNTYPGASGSPQLASFSNAFIMNGDGININNLGNTGNLLSITGTTTATARVGVGSVTSPSARLHLPAGSATANTAPLKLNTGTALSATEDGALEYHTSHLYFTIGSTRYQLDQQGDLVTTFYTGDGTVTGNRTVNLNNLNLTFSDVNTFRINHDVFAWSKADGTFPYSNVIVAPSQQWWLGYTPTVGSFSKGSAIAIDTNNNVALGTSAPPVTAPLYADGAAYLHGLQSGRGNFYRVGDLSADHTMALTEYWVNIDATGGNITITLPAASTAFGSNMGIQYVMRRVDNSGNTITVNRAGSDTINGATSFSLTTQYQVQEVQCISSSTWALK